VQLDRKRTIRLDTLADLRQVAADPRDASSLTIALAVVVAAAMANGVIRLPERIVRHMQSRGGAQYAQNGAGELPFAIAVQYTQRTWGC